MHGKNGISPEMAIRLPKAFVGSSEVWLGVQMDYDLEGVEKKAGGVRVKRVPFRDLMRQNLFRDSARSCIVE